jgi:hypothetical protein
MALAIRFSFERFDRDGVSQALDLLCGPLRSVFVALAFARTAIFP